MNAYNQPQDYTQVRTAVATVLKKYKVEWQELSQNNAVLAWQALGGVWKGKKVLDASQWQKKIRRREWDRKVI